MSYFSSWFHCRGCKGPPTQEKWIGLCPNCNRPYRPIPCRVVDGKKVEDGDEDFAIIEDGEMVSPDMALKLAKQSGAMEKTPTGLEGFDWILGGGLLKGKAVAFCGMEGAGKTSFLFKLAQSCERQKLRMILCSSEQVPEDLAVQFERYGKIPKRYVSLVHRKDCDKILQLLDEERPRIFALDSVHDVEGITDEDGCGLASGGSRAVHRMAAQVRDVSRDAGAFSMLVCHMNVDGTIKGGTSLRHEVDGNLMLERPADENDVQRVLRFKKYRFAPPKRRSRYMALDNDFKDCGPLVDESAPEPEPDPPQRSEKPNLRLVKKEDDK